MDTCQVSEFRALSTVREHVLHVPKGTVLLEGIQLEMLESQCYAAGHFGWNPSVKQQK